MTQIAKHRPFHEKYRSTTFAQLIGQDAIAITLSSALDNNALAYAYLFCGARGTGKTSSARIFAKSLNCLSYDRPTSTPCGKCEVCIVITAGTAVDVQEIDAADKTGVDEVRQLVENAQFTPMQCRYKVYIMDEAHSLSRAAMDALLKTLEHPPNQVIFILCTTEPYSLSKTLVSRCQRYDFRNIELEAIKAHLLSVAEQEGITIEPSGLHLIAQVAKGGMRDALSLLEQLTIGSKRITLEQVQAVSGQADEAVLMGILVSILKHQSSIHLIESTHQLINRGINTIAILEGLNRLVQALIVASETPNDPFTQVMPQTWNELCEIAAEAPTEQVQAIHAEILSIEPQIR